MAAVRVTFILNMSDDRALPVDRVRAWAENARPYAISLHPDAYLPGDPRATEDGWAYITSLTNVTVTPINE